MTASSWKQRITTAVVTAAMAVSMLPMSAFGAGELALDSSISVGGLEKGDSASFYRIIEQDLNDDTKEPPYIGTQDWKLTEAVDKDKNGIVDGTENTDFGHKNEEGNAVKGLWVDELIASESDTEVITAKMANAIASAIAKNNPDPTYAVVSADDDGVATVSDEEGNPLAGTYMVVATPGEDNIDTIYKPIFVSADYNKSDKTDSIELEPNKTDYKFEQGVDATFKRSDLDVDKKSGVYDEDGETEDTQNDVAVGDEVDFTITTNIPTYSANYTSPVYKLTDKLTSGLVLTDDEINVSVEGYDDLELGKDYKVTKNSDGDGFVVEFLNDKDSDPATKDGFLYTVVGSPKVTITYKARVTEDAAEINQMDNTVKLNFSNTLDDTKGEGELQDKTRHYTFNIDANIFGPGYEPGEVPTPGEQEKTITTSEVRKTAVTTTTTTITEVLPTTTANLPAEPTGFEWLEGAKFELKQTHKYQTPDPANEDASENFVEHEELIKFNDDQVKDATGKDYVTSDEYGYIAMKGLDAGIYILREIDAPLGYTFDPSLSYKVTIEPTYTTENPSSTDPEDYNVILQSYTITIEKLQNGEPVDPESKSVSTYTAETDDEGTPLSFLNDSFPPEGSEVEPGERSEATITLKTDSTTTLIVNTELGLLPATGGSGIFFYLIVGGIIAGTAAVLINKDRKREHA